MRTVIACVALSIAVASCGGSSDPSATTAPDGGGVVAGEFFIESLDVRVAESFPVQLFLDVEGNAPTPCHEVVWDVEEAEGERRVTIWTEVDPDIVCIQVLESHTFTIPLGAAPDLPVDVWVNGELIRTVEG
jgi:hypothetical protein